MRTMTWRSTNIGKATFFFVLCLAVTASCVRKTSRLPDSSSRQYEVVVAGDKNGTITNALSVPVPGLPQNEPAFDVLSANKTSNVTNNVPDNVLNNVPDKYRYARSIVIFDRHTKLSAAHDRWASPQLIIRTDGTCPEALRRLINKFEAECQLRQIEKKRNGKAEEYILKTFRHSIAVPADLKAMKKGHDFLWLSNNTAESMKNIVVMKLTEGTDNIDGINDILKHNIKGETNCMYMRIANVSDSTAGNCYGLWEIRNDIMGGPYSLRIFKDRTAVLAFVYAPEKGKRNLMRQMQTILLSADSKAVRR